MGVSERGPRYRIVEGGEPTPAQLAAMVVALTPREPDDTGPEADDPGGEERDPERTSPWGRAGRLEAVTGRRVVDPTTLAALERSAECR